MKIFISILFVASLLFSNENINQKSNDLNSTTQQIKNNTKITTKRNTKNDETKKAIEDFMKKYSRVSKGC